MGDLDPPNAGADRCRTPCSRYGFENSFCGGKGWRNYNWWYCAQPDWSNCRGATPYMCELATIYYDQDEPVKEFDLPDISDLPDIGGSGDNDGEGNESGDGNQ